MTPASPTCRLAITNRRCVRCHAVPAEEVAFVLDGAVICPECGVGEEPEAASTCVVCRRAGTESPCPECVGVMNRWYATDLDEQVFDG